MQEAFIKLFSTGDSTQTAALIIILGLTFLLGALVWAVLAHFPSTRKLKIANKEFETQNGFLQKENTDLSERYTVVNAKLNRATEDLQTAEANLKEKSEKVEAQLSKIKTLSEDLVLYKDNARNFKESYEKLLEQYKLLSDEHKKALEQVEGMKGIVEEVESEKKALVRKYQNADTALNENDEKLKQTSDNLNRANETVFLLKKDLEAALAQRAELRKMVNETEAVKGLASTDDAGLRTQVVGLKEHVRALEEENTDLMNKMAPYLAKEQQARRQADQLDELLVNLLVDAEQSMKSGAFYTDINEEELIADPKYLKQSLSELVLQEPLSGNKGGVELTEKDHAKLDRALQKVADAMKLQGFYSDIEEAVLLQQEKSTLTDDQLMDLHLEDATKNIENAFFFNEDSTHEGFVADQQLLDSKLASLKLQEPLAENQVSYLQDKDHPELDAALDAAMTALAEEGLYEPIDSEKLIGSFEGEEVLEHNKKYESELEKLVLQDIGRKISTASEKDKNDLKQIDGIGMFVEQRLNQLGIYTFEQISQFDSTFITKLSAVLGFSEQTIVRDGWVEQAKELLSA